MKNAMLSGLWFLSFAIMVNTCRTFEQTKDIAQTLREMNQRCQPGSAR